MSSDPEEVARTLAAFACVPLSEERAAALAGAVQLARQIGETFARLEFGATEPASQFRAPRDDR